MTKKIFLFLSRKIVQKWTNGIPKKEKFYTTIGRNGSLNIRIVTIAVEI